MDTPSEPWAPKDYSTGTGQYGDIPVGTGDAPRGYFRLAVRCSRGRGTDPDTDMWILYKVRIKARDLHLGEVSTLHGTDFDDDVIWQIEEPTLERLFRRFAAYAIDARADDIFADRTPLPLVTPYVHDAYENV